MKAARLAVYMARNTTAKSAQILDMNLGGVNNSLFVNVGGVNNRLFVNLGGVKNKCNVNEENQIDFRCLKAKKKFE